MAHTRHNHLAKPTDHYIRHLYPTGLAANTVYEARAATVCSANDISDFISFLFQTGCKPIDNTWVETTATTAKLNWNSSPDDRYQVQWRPYNSFDWNGITDIAATSAMLSGLLPGTLYEWRVRVICPAGEVAFTTIKTFRTGCSSPTSLYWSSRSPTDVLLSWSNPSGATDTELQWRQRGSLDWQSVQATKWPYLLSRLTPGITYEWRVRQLCTPLESSPFVDGSPIYYACPGSVPIIGREALGKLQVSWQGYLGLTYTVRWRAFGTGAWVNSPPISATATSYLTYQPTGMMPNYLYEIGIVSNCNSAFSSAIALTPPDCSTMYTVRDGSWVEPGIWSCARLPISADAIHLYHAVTIPGQFTGEARRLNYGPGTDRIGGKIETRF
jgi:hypothetical protein